MIAAVACLVLAGLSLLGSCWLMIASVRRGRHANRIAETDLTEDLFASAEEHRRAATISQIGVVLALSAVVLSMLSRLFI